MSRIGETGVGEMGIGETGVGEMGVGETGTNRGFDIRHACTCSKPSVHVDFRRHTTRYLTQNG